MERWAAPTLQRIFAAPQRYLDSASAVFGSPDGRWAFASTSITALVAGTVAWLAAGAAPQPPVSAHGPQSGRSLLPYQVFMNLTSHGDEAKAIFAAFSPAAAIVPKRSVAPQPSSALDDALTAEQFDDDTDPDANTSTITLHSGDTLAGALTEAGVSAADSHAAIAALRKVFDPHQIRAGQSFQLSFAPQDNKRVARITYTPPNQTEDSSAGDQSAPSDSDQMDRLLSLSFSPELDHEVTVSRATDGSFSARDAEKKLVAQYHRAGGKIDSSLYLAAVQAGIPADIVVQMIRIFSYQVDFQRDIHPGDTFQVLYNYYYTPDGKPGEDGHDRVRDHDTGRQGLRALSLSAGWLRRRGLSRCRRPQPQEPADAHARRRGAHQSSFGMRFHPVLGYHAHAQGHGFCCAGGHAGDGGRLGRHQIRRP